MLIDLHAHTSGISKCCRIPAPEVLRIAKENGIDGIVLANHYQKSYVKDMTVADFASKYIEEYADGNSERGKKMRKTICEKFKFDSLGFQTVDGVIKAIGIEPCKLCTYCWNGKE